MTTNTSTTSLQTVNWRAAIMLPGNPQPLHGRITGASEQQLVGLFPVSVPVKDCRLYLDLLDPERKTHCYVDCRVKITTQTLVGQISQFRVFMQIVELQDEQRRFLLARLPRH
ncbi:hypothetical protein [Chitinilyticum litopenaei]|uniref:hypothetical protein n=1 Tax=Chitinilyticum litopenaei TaxID=1121276 RepID=UPI00049025C6|nr:hypothetical protein [Chitinilyticum litopenaei]